jgi:hypothetical protein
MKYIAVKILVISGQKLQFGKILYFCPLRYSMNNGQISYLVNGWWDCCKLGIILKGLPNENNSP